MKVSHREVEGGSSFRENSRVHQDQFSPSFLRILYMFYSVLELSLSLSGIFSLFCLLPFFESFHKRTEMDCNQLISFPFLSSLSLPLSLFLTLSHSIFSFQLVSRLLVPRFFLSCLPCLAHSLISRVLFYSMNSSFYP